MKVQYLIFLTDQQGILDHSKALISEITHSGLQKLIADGVVQGGMLTKANTILSALENGVSAVRVMNGKDALKGLWSDPVGTWCFPKARQDYLRSANTLEESLSYAYN